MLAASRVMFYGGILCVLSLLIPAWEQREIPNGTDFRFSLGLPHSPWFVHASTETKVETRAEGMITTASMNSTFSNRVEFISWSSLMLVLGLVLAQAGESLGKRCAARNSSAGAS